MVENSSPQGGGDRTLGRRVLEGSRLVRWVRAARSVREARSLASRTGNRLRDITTGSWLYQWLTAEPEPAVITIDLRETYTVGPFIQLLDATVERTLPYWEASTAKSLVDAGANRLEALAATRPGRLLIAVLEPPEPPEEADRTSEGGPVDGETFEAETDEGEAETDDEPGEDTRESTE